MEFLYKWLALAGLQSIAAISPGPAFVLQVKSTLAHGRTYGLYTALGLSMGVALYAFAVMAGLAVVLAGSKDVMVFLRYAGAAYLIYIGIKGLRSKSSMPPASLDSMDIARDIAISGKKKWQAFTAAFIAQILNPKALVYFTAVFAQFITPNAPLWTLALYGLTVTLVELGWWIGLTFILSHRRIKEKFTKFSQWIDRICGGLLVALGIRLAM